jgi:hypothetical protein
MSENPDLGHPAKPRAITAHADLQLESNMWRPTMKIGKSGDGLAIRIPAAIVKKSEFEARR